MEYLNAAQVAELLGIGKKLVYEQTKAGVIPHVKLGRVYRYSREVLEEWVRQQAASSCKPALRAL